MSAVNYIHGKNVVHRDLKPCNILFNVAETEIKVADFGIARRKVDSETNLRISGRGGTAIYMAPELVSRLFTSSIV